VGFHNPARALVSKTKEGRTTLDYTYSEKSGYMKKWKDIIRRRQVTLDEAVYVAGSVNSPTRSHDSIYTHLSIRSGAIEAVMSPYNA